MKVLILGGGQVGSSLAETLVAENNDITLVESNPDQVKKIQDTMDLRAIVGNAADPEILESAGADDCDILIAATQSDETNLVACKIASLKFNVPTKIARIRSSSYLNSDLFGHNGFSIDYTICPEQVVTDYIVRLVEIPGALQALDFADGKLTLVAVSALQNGPLVDHPIKDFTKRLPIPARVAGIFRRNMPIIQDGDTTIIAGDEVFLLAESKNIKRVMQEMRQGEKPVNRIMIAGGGNIGLRLARALETHYEVKIIEQKKSRCEHLSTRLNNTLILHGNSADADLLETENVSDMDMFIAVTNEDEDNIMSSLLAKRLGARRSLSLINRHAYADLIHGNQIDVAISPGHATVGALLSRIRRGDVSRIHYLRRGKAEAIEIVAHGDKHSSRIVGKAIEDIPLPRGADIIAVVRGEEVLMAQHDLVIQTQDHVILFIASRGLVKKVEKLFEVGFRFF